ncbi:ICOS ligand-like [Polypterus senegalus]|uniref:ICOS ligand-like n=1 Tax=Polypterus senegalus TaxID=55291 RepID=UPI001963F041|nr:ICOS ligand-like [Polypterus senegalus]
MACIWMKLCPLLLSLVCVSADECLTASIGKTVQIPCFVKTNESLKAENISVEWTTSEGLIIHSFVTGKDDLTNQDSRFKGRTQLFSSGVSRGDLSLSLLNVSVDDEGTFKCSYYDSSIGDDNSRDLSKHCLQVADHYSVPIVYGPPAGLNKSEVNFTCKSMGGHPEPKVRWSVNNKPLEDSRRVTTTPSRDSRGRYNVTSVLTVNVTRDVSVTCTVENERLREQRTSAEIQYRINDHESVQDHANATNVVIKVVVMGLLIVGFVALILWIKKTCQSHARPGNNNANQGRINNEQDEAQSSKPKIHLDVTVLHQSLEALQYKLI